MAKRPMISGTTGGQQSTNESSVAPFSQTTITDANQGASDTLTIALEGSGGTLSGNGLTATGAKTYTLSGTAAQVTAELQALTFKSAAGKPGSQTTTRFRLTDRSSAAANMPATDNTTSVVDSDTPAAPAVPRLTAATDTGASHTDGLTNDTSPTVTGNARPGAAVTVYAGNTVIGQGTASASTGAYSIAVTGLSQGTNAVSATQTIHGLTSARSAARTIVLDTASPIITAAIDNAPGIGVNGSGTVGVGKEVTFTLRASEPLYVTGGKPTLTLNNGGIATYVGGAGKSQLVFRYVVAVGQDTNSLKTTTLAANGAIITDKAGNVLNAATLSSATMPTGDLIVKTTAPVVSLTNAGGTTSKSMVTLTGSVFGADPKSKISVYDNSSTAAIGTTKVNADGTFKLPVKLTAGRNALSVRSTDGAGNVSQPVAVTYIENPTTISIDQTVSYNGGTFNLGGHISDANMGGSVEFYSRVRGQRQDLGAATVDANGNFNFKDMIGSHTQGFITAVDTDSTGSAVSAQANFSLTGGRSGAYEAEQDRYTAQGSAVTATDQFKADGSQKADLFASGQAFASSFFDTFQNSGAPRSSFVFNPGFGRDSVDQFRVDGTDHDVLNFKGSDYGSSIATVLNSGRDTAAGLLITDPTSSSPGGGAGSHDTLLLKGITKAQLTANQGDIKFHA